MPNCKVVTGDYENYGGKEGTAPTGLSYVAKRTLDAYLGVFPEIPIDPSSMTRWRQRIGKEGAEELLKQTLETAIEEGHLKPSQCQRVSVDTTVQTKAI